jgi:hypothetical protein
VGQRISATLDSGKQKNCSLAAVQVYAARDLDKLSVSSSCGSHGVHISLPLPQSRGECRSHARCRLRRGSSQGCISRLALVLLCRTLKQGVCCSAPQTLRCSAYSQGYYKQGLIIACIEAATIERMRLASRTLYATIGPFRTASPSSLVIDMLCHWLAG